MHNTCGSLYCLLHPGLIAGATRGGKSRTRSATPPSSHAAAASAEPRPEYARITRPKTKLGYVGDDWGGGNTNQLGKMYGMTARGVADVLQDSSKTIVLRAWAARCVRLPSGEEVSAADYYHATEGQIHVVYVEADDAGKETHILLRLVSAPERLPSHGSAVAKHGAAVLPPALVETSRARLPHGFSMDYSEGAGALFYRNVFDQPDGVECAAIQVVPIGLLHVPSRPVAAQPRPVPAPLLSGGAAASKLTASKVGLRAAALPRQGGAIGARSIAKPSRGAAIATAAAAAVTAAAAAATIAPNAAAASAAAPAAMPAAALAPATGLPKLDPCSSYVGGIGKRRGE